MDTGQASSLLAIYICYLCILKSNNITFFSELAAEVMIELLRNYTADDGKQAKDDAKRCIVSAIADPKTFLFEPLLSLTPVISLQNSPLHELLVIFVSGNLTNYLDFYKGHKDLIKSLGITLSYIILSYIRNGQTFVTFFFNHD